MGSWVRLPQVHRTKLSRYHCITRWGVLKRCGLMRCISTSGRLSFVSTSFGRYFDVFASDYFYAIYVCTGNSTRNNTCVVTLDKKTSEIYLFYFRVSLKKFESYFETIGFWENVSDFILNVRENGPFIHKIEHPTTAISNIQWFADYLSQRSANFSYAGRKKNNKGLTDQGKKQMNELCWWIN